MNKKLTIRYTVLGILFFLPVIFLLMMMPAKHNYTPLDILNENVMDLDSFHSDTEEEVRLKDHITVLGFLGKNPMDKVITASNLKELVYDKFKGFKKFQMVIIVPEGAEDEIESLKKEIQSYEDLKYWQFVYGDEEDIHKLYRTLATQSYLDTNLATDAVFIIDKDLNQRGRIDDRSDNEVERNKPVYALAHYDAIEVAEIKNKMSEDVRILFTEYREKRKGDFDSNTRRANDLKAKNEN